MSKLCHGETREILSQPEKQKNMDTATSGHAEGDETKNQCATILSSSPRDPNMDHMLLKLVYCACPYSRRLEAISLSPASRTYYLPIVSGGCAAITVLCLRDCNLVAHTVILTRLKRHSPSCSG